MSWNLFEKIINAVRPSENSEQTDSVEQPESVCSQVPSQSQSWDQGEDEQPDSSQQPVDDDENWQG